MDVYVSAPDGITLKGIVVGASDSFSEKPGDCGECTGEGANGETVNVAMTVKAAEGTDFSKVKAAVETELAEQFNGKLLGQGVKLAELNSRIYALPGVENCHITAPVVDLAANDKVLPVLGTVTVTEEA